MVSMMGGKPKFWIGTSGYYYKGWLGRFYPPELKPRAMLTYYSRHFPFLELNCTFYRMPTRRMFRSMVERTPEGFQFVVKMPSSVTHELRLERAGAFVKAVELLSERRRLDGLLLQFPERFSFGTANSDFLKKLCELLKGMRVFVEYRHRSWQTERAMELAAELGVALVSVDVPDIETLLERRLLLSGHAAYVRFHSRAKENWYKPGRDRYDYLYSDAELNEWLDELDELSEVVESVRIVFNNCRRAQAAANAARVRELVEQRFGLNAIAGRDALEAANCLMPLFA